MPEDQMMQDIIPEDVPMEAGLQEPPVFEEEMPKQFGISEDKLEEIRKNVKREIDRAD